MEREKTRPFDDWVLYLTNHFTHPVLEAQGASPKFHLARKLSEKGQKVLVYCPIGRHVGNPFRDFVTNLSPKRTASGNTVYLFPPVIVSPASATTALTLIMGTLFILTYLTLTRIKVAAQYSNPILVGSVGAVVRMRKKIPLVANYGDPDFAREFGLARRAFGFCEGLVMARGNAHAVIYWDEVLGEYIRHGFPVKNTLFLPNGGYEAGFAPPSPGSPAVVALKSRLGLEGRPIVLYAGQITRVYRLDILVDAAPYIISKVPNVRFLIVGDGATLPAMREWVRKAQLDDHFVFTGAVPYEDLSPYVVMSDICVNLLNDWCMGTKVVMYMVHGKAVVAGGSWYDRYKLFLRNGDNSLLVPADVDAFGKEVVVALKDQELRLRVGESAWRTVSPYTWDRHAEDTMRLLRESFSSRKTK